jgi:hypothetical protein
MLKQESPEEVPEEGNPNMIEIRWMGGTLRTLDEEKLFNQFSQFLVKNFHDKEEYSQLPNIIRKLPNDTNLNDRERETFEKISKGAWEKVKNLELIELLKTLPTSTFKSKLRIKELGTVSNEEIDPDAEDEIKWTGIDIDGKRYIYDERDEAQIIDVYYGDSKSTNYQKYAGTYNKKNKTFEQDTKGTQLKVEEFDLDIKDINDKSKVTTFIGAQGNPQATGRRKEVSDDEDDEDVAQYPYKAILDTDAFLNKKDFFKGLGKKWFDLEYEGKEIVENEKGEDVWTKWKATFVLSWTDDVDERTAMLKREGISHMFWERPKSTPKRVISTSGASERGKTNWFYPILNLNTSIEIAQELSEEEIRDGISEEEKRLIEGAKKKLDKLLERQEDLKVVTEYKPSKDVEHQISNLAQPNKDLVDPNTTTDSLEEEFNAQWIQEGYLWEVFEKLGVVFPVGSVGEHKITVVISESKTTFGDKGATMKPTIEIEQTFTQNAILSPNPKKISPDKATEFVRTSRDYAMYNPFNPTRERLIFSLRRNYTRLENVLKQAWDAL